MKVIITVREPLEKISEVATELEGKGMEVGMILPMTGVIFGKYDGDIEDLKSVKGVQDVEEELEAHISNKD